jgi:hypothetical protein
MNGKYFRFLAEQRQVSLEDCDDSGWTALHWLAFRRDPGRVSLLLDLGTNVNASSQSGFSPLHMIGFPLNFSNFQRGKIRRTGGDSDISWVLNHPPGIKVSNISKDTKTVECSASFRREAP